MTIFIILVASILSSDSFEKSVHQVDRAHLVSANGAFAEVPLRHLLKGVPGGVVSQKYRIRLPDGIDRTRPLAVYFPGSSAQLEVMIGSARIYTSRRSNHPLETQASRPQLVQLPYPLSPDIEAFDVLMRSDPSGGLVLMRFWIGPLEELGPAYERRYFLRYQGAEIMALFHLIAGLTAFAFWLADRSYKSPLWFGLFCVPTSIAIKIGLSTTTPYFPAPLTLHFAILLINLSFAALAQFVFEKTARRSRGHDRLIVGYIAASLILLVALYENELPYFRYALVMDACAIALGAYILYVLLDTWRKKRDSISRLLLWGVGLTLLLGCYSVFANWRPDSQEDSYQVLYAPLPLIVSMGWAICRRYARSSLRWQALNRILAKRVRRREQEIEHAYAQLASLEKDKAIQTERERFMRDMHDGLGSQLITSLRMAQRGTLSQEQMQELLSGCLDEMHFAIQSLKTTGDDLFVALADYRYRLEPRLQAGGIRLQWEIEHEPCLKMKAGDALQVLRILNEAVGNAIKHSGSSRISIAGSTQSEEYMLFVRDNGQGFPDSVRRGVGLDSMRTRAESLGARFLFHNDGGGWIQLYIPLQRHKEISN
jgi:signal transduction histidine kinase